MTKLHVIRCKNTNTIWANTFGEWIWPTRDKALKAWNRAHGWKDNLESELCTHEVTLFELPYDIGEWGEIKTI